MLNFSKCIVTIWLAATITSTVVWADKARIAAELQSSQAVANEVIVQYKVAPTDAHYGRVRKLGGTVRQSFDRVKSAHYSISKAAIEALAQDPDVESISPNREVRGMLDIPAATVNLTPATMRQYDGTGISVAVIDSGIADLPQFHSRYNRVVYQATFVGGSPTDQYGHGTHVAGLIASDGNGTVYTGMATGVNLINLRALDGNGQGSDASVIAAINAAIQLKDTFNIRVINLSLGRPVAGPYSYDPLCQAVEAAWRAGIVVVVAAGNEGRNNSANTQGYGTIMAPGNDPYAITVGAMKDMGTSNRSDDLIASYSSKGPTLFDHVVKPDILAPGNRIVSTMPSTATMLEKNSIVKVAANEYVLSGTSMATPIVSGAVVVLLGAYDRFSPDQVKVRLMRTASKTFPINSTAVDPVTKIAYTSYYDIFTVGAGYLDLGAALTENSFSWGSAASPTVSYDKSAGKVLLQGIGGSNPVWGGNLVWANNLVWGNNIVWGNNVVWGNNLVWGSSYAAGFNIVWGSNVVWGCGDQVSGESAAIAINGEP